MESTQLTNISDRQNSLEWRLYQNMLVTRLFEEALIRWEHEGKLAAQTFPSKGQEAIAVGSCLALEKGDTVIPSFRTRGAMIAMGIGLDEQLREFVHSPQRRRGFARRAASQFLARARCDAGIDDDRRSSGDGGGFGIGNAIRAAAHGEPGFFRRWHPGLRRFARNHACCWHVESAADFGLRK